MLRSHSRSFLDTLLKEIAEAPLVKLCCCVWDKISGAKKEEPDKAVMTRDFLRST